MLNQNLKQLKFLSTVIEHKRPQQFGSSNVYDWLNLHLICRAPIRSNFFLFLFSAVFIRIPLDSVHCFTFFEISLVDISERSDAWWHFSAFFQCAWFLFSANAQMQEFLFGFCPIPPPSLSKIKWTVPNLSYTSCRT